MKYDHKFMYSCTFHFFLFEEQYFLPEVTLFKELSQLFKNHRGKIKDFKDVMFFQRLFKAHANDMQHTHVIALEWKTPTTAGATPIQLSLPLHLHMLWISISPTQHHGGQN